MTVSSQGPFCSFFPALNVVYAVLSLCLALTVIELLIGGTRLLFSLPAYGILAVAALASLADLRRSKPLPDRLCLLGSALFFGYLMARALASPVVYLAWPDEFAIAGSLVVYLLTACYLTDPRRRLWVLGWLLVIAGVNLGVGARQFTEGGNYMLFGFLRSAQYTGRASGLYICPDHLAGFLEVVVCLSLAMVMWSRCRAWVKVLLGYGALCGVAGLLATGSRGGALSFGAGVGVLTVLGLWRAGTSGTGFLRGLLAVGIALALLAGGIGAALTLSPALQARAHILLDKKDIRLKMWPAAIREFDDDRTFGTGSGTYLYYGRRYRDPSVQNDPIRPHNDYLELLAEYGVVGAAGFLLFLGAHLRWGWRAFRHLSLSSGGGGGQQRGGMEHRRAGGGGLPAGAFGGGFQPAHSGQRAVDGVRFRRAGQPRAEPAARPGSGPAVGRPALARAFAPAGAARAGRLDPGGGDAPSARRLLRRTGARGPTRPPQRRRVELCPAGVGARATGTRSCSATSATPG